MSESRNDDVGGAIKDFIKRQREEAERRRQEELRASQAAERTEVPPPVPEPQQGLYIIVNYKNCHAEFEINSAFPTMIKKRFEIESGIVELSRKSITYTETSDNTFEPPLVVGTVTIYYHEKSTKVDINDDKTITLRGIEFFNNRNTWNSAFLVDENNAELTRITRTLRNLEYKNGTKYGLLFCCEQDTRQQLVNVRNRNIIIPSKTESKSLRGVSMAGSIVFWVAFSRIFFVLSKINKDFKLQNVKKLGAIACPTSLKTSLFQIALSINDFLNLQVSNAYHLFKDERMNENHYGNSLKRLMKLRAEVNHFIKVLTKYLTDNEPNEATVVIVNQLKELEEYDAQIKHEQDEYRTGKDVSKLVTVNTSTIFSSKDNPDGDLEVLVKKRTVLNYILKSVRRMTLQQNFDISKIIHLSKFLKELICTEISHFLHADFINKYSESDITEESKSVQEQYENVYELWRLIGTQFSLVIDFDEELPDWDSLKKEVLKSQHMAELGFHEITHRPPPVQEDEINSE